MQHLITSYYVQTDGYLNKKCYKNLCPCIVVSCSRTLFSCNYVYSISKPWVPLCLKDKHKSLEGLRFQISGTMWEILQETSTEISHKSSSSEVQQKLSWDCLLTLENWALIHFVKVFFWTASCSSEAKRREEEREWWIKIKGPIL